MQLEELVSELHKLSRADKLRAVQILVHDLAIEENALLRGTHFEVWSPFDAPSAAETLLQMLEEDRAAGNG
ncbi:MAG: hypothetical protein K8L97_11915 [Anaerolineae bacterium]|nr:hypothetical protein [Anaerolineae bacterium]